MNDVLPTSTTDVPDVPSSSIDQLLGRLRKLELENLQLRKENLLVQLRLLEIERGHAVDETDPDAWALIAQVKVLCTRIRAA